MEDCSIDAKRLSVADVFPIESSFSPSLFDHAGESPKFAEQKGSKKYQRYNSRKSLGWDSEFLNSPGVLEPDELTSMIESAEKIENSEVPEIQERQKSNDSKSALVSESLKTANLQDGCSEDTRASVQRSGKASRVENSSGKARSVVPDSHTNQSPKKKELASHGKLKPKPSSMKLSAGTPKSGKAANSLTIHPRVLQLRNNYSGGQSDSSSSEPPSPETHSPVVSSTKRNSRAEKKNAESAAGKRASSSKKIQQSSVSHSMILPGPSSSRSASSPAAAKKAMNSSVDSFISASSSSTINSAAVITEPTRSTYASVLKKPAPPRTTTATSVGVRSSKSTSSIPTTMQRSKSTRASTDISSRNTPSQPLVSSKQSNDGKKLSGQKTRLAAPSTQNGRSASLGRGTNSVKPSSASQFQPQMHRSSSTISPASSSPDGSIRSTSSLSSTKPRSSSATVRMGQSHQREAAPGSMKSPKPANDQLSSASQFQPQVHRSSSARLSNSTISPASSSPDRSVRSTSSLSTTKPRSSSATMHRSSSARLSASTLSSASLSPDQSISSTSSLSTTKTRNSSATLRMGQSNQREAAPGPLKSPKPSNNQQLDGQKSKMSARPAQHGRSASTGRLVVTPSALNMPSPKIGFSDGVKSGRTPKGTKQPPNLVPGGLPKSGAKTADANESSINKLKFGSIPSPRSTPKIGSKKAENNKQSRSPQEPSSSAEKVSSRLSQPQIQDPKSGKRSANKEGGSRSRDKESRPSEVQTVKNHSIGGENPAAKPELASNELMKTVDSPQKVSEISSPEVSSTTLSAKADQSTGGGRMPSEMPTVKNHSIGVKVDENPASKLELASNESAKTQKVSETSSPEVSSSTLLAKADQSTGGGRTHSEIQTVKNQSIGVKVGGENPASKLELASNESVKTVDSSQKVSETSSPEVSSSAKADQSTGGGRMPSEMQTVKNHSIGVKVDKNPASKLELASNELVKTVDSSKKVSETSTPEVSSSTLSAKADQSTGGGRKPSEMQTVKNQSIGVKVGGENPASKLEPASNESVKTVDSSQKVSEISSSKVSSSTLPAKADQSTGGERMPFSAIHCNKDGSSDGLTGLTQVEKKITISSSPKNALDHVESSR